LREPSISGKQRIRFLERISRDGHRMISHKDRGLFQMHVQPGFELFARVELCSAQVIQRRRARPVHAPFFLVHRDDPPPRFDRRREMNVAHFRQRVSNGVVNRTFADLSAFDVCNGNTQRQRNGSRSEQLIPVGDQQQNIRSHLPEVLREAERRHADRLGHAHVGIRAEQALDPRSDRKSVLLNFPHRVAELRGKMRPHDNQFQIHLGMGREIAQRPVQMAVIGARRGDNGDLAFQGFLTLTMYSRVQAMFR